MPPQNTDPLRGSSADPDPWLSALRHTGICNEHTHCHGPQHQGHCTATTHTAQTTSSPPTAVHDDTRFRFGPADLDRRLIGAMRTSARALHNTARPNCPGPATSATGVQPTRMRPSARSCRDAHGPGPATSAISSRQLSCSARRDRDASGTHNARVRCGPKGHTATLIQPYVISHASSGYAELSSSKKSGSSVLPISSSSLSPSSPNLACRQIKD